MRRLLLILLAFLLTAGLSAGAVAALDAVRRGPAGERGLRGASGTPSVVAQRIALNWQNGAEAGRDRQEFRVPGIGSGDVVCSTKAQQLRLRPDDQQADTTMWTARIENADTDVRTARRERFTGPQFNEGLNLRSLIPDGNGTFVGIISSRGDRDAPGGVGVGGVPAPTTFRLSWSWKFDDGNPRCYVAGVFVTEA